MNKLFSIGRFSVCKSLIDCPMPYCVIMELNKGPYVIAVFLVEVDAFTFCKAAAAREGVGE